MRVIAGSAKGTHLKAVPGSSTRPILDRVKTPLFDILQTRLAGGNGFAGATVLDAFAGTGAVGIEALSREAALSIFLDVNAQAVTTIKENLEKTGLGTRAQIKHTDAFQFMRASSKSFDLIFADPPQFKNLWLDAVFLVAERPTLLSPEGLLVVKLDPKEYESLDLTTLRLCDERRYGNSMLLFFKPALR